LSRLSADYLDLYQCHWPDPMTSIEATLEEMLKMQSEGKIRFIGLSNFDLPLLEKALALSPVTSLQIQYSLLERRVEESGLLEFCKKKGVGVMTYGSLGGGLLTGKYKNLPTFSKKDARRFFYPFYKPQEWQRYQGVVEAIQKIAQEKEKPLVQIALNWLIQQSGVTTALVGARTREQVGKNVDAIQVKLSKCDLVRIEKVYYRFIKNFS
ncbi:MAG TPA: aldo/keto reductase, partial [Thermodesulfobacteriota bacterium]|nr:aldo/keto reductase [Thermodesulfobacteriota bacterium]